LPLVGILTIGGNSPRIFANLEFPFSYSMEVGTMQD